MTNPLIKKLRDATGPDRGLDAEIFKAFNDVKPGYHWDFQDGELSQVLWMRKPGFASIPINMPAYTASLDAALALVAECDQLVRYISWHRFEGEAEIVHATVGRTQPEGKTGRHADPAIAVLIALLEARAAILQAQGETE